MEAIDLTSRNQRYGLLALTVVYPAVWLIGLGNIMSSSVWPRGAALPAFPIFLVSAAGALVTIHRARSGRLPSWLQRYAIYIVWGWLVPFCLIALAAVSEFASLWPALSILALPAPAFLFLRMGRERFLVCAVACGALAWLALMASFEASLSFKAQLLVPLVLTAGPFWSLAGYAALYEHVVHSRVREPGGERETRIACVVSLIGILLFFGIVVGVAMIILSGFR